MPKKGAVSIAIGTILLIVNLIGLFAKPLVTGKGCFLCVVDHAPSLDGQIINQFFTLGLVTAVATVLIIVGFWLRRKHA